MHPTDKSQTTAPIADPVYLSQLETSWRQAREHLVRCAHAGREAQRRWDDAISRELETHRRMRMEFEAVGAPLPEGVFP